MNKFYITTTLPYVNAEPHIGFALEIVKADAIARSQRQLGNEVIFNTGTDEHGQKIYQKALEEHKTPQEYCDEYAAKFEELKSLLDLSYTNFIRTTEDKHVRAAQEFWRRCDKNGYIYKKLYKVKYCVGCELEKTDSELVDGKCPLHPNKELEIREEENYFFKFSAFQKPLLDFYASHPKFVEPEAKFNEIRSFVEMGLQDFSISRLKEKMPWGVPVPGDDAHVMYVWFDALVNYISTLGWPDDEANFSAYWPGIQIAGKDNLRQQSAMWQAMLMGADLPNSQKILINGFISVDGQKMSKSLGNVISPNELVERYGVDGTRYILLSLGALGDDSDVSWEKFDQKYSSDLANGLGNLVSRISKLCEKFNIFLDSSIFPAIPNTAIQGGFVDHINNYEFHLALEELWRDLRDIDKELNTSEPWKHQNEDSKKTVTELARRLLDIGFALKPFMPSTSGKIISVFSENPIKPSSPLFPRIT